MGYEIVNKKLVDDSELYAKAFGKESVENRRFYNICAGGHLGFGGGFNHPCWTNLDVIRPIRNGFSEYNPDKDVVYDLLEMNPLPIEDNAAEIIQSQYAIEHITNEAAEHFFKEVYRTLKPGGIFKVVAPNIELDYLAYQKKDKGFYFWVDQMSHENVYNDLGFNGPLNNASFEQVVIVHFAANASTIHVGGNAKKIDDKEFEHVMNTMKKEDAFDYCTSKCSVDIQKKFRQNHINWWNHEKLILALKKAGFRNCSIMAPGQSSQPVLRNNQYFDNLWNGVALFVEAIKD